MCLSRFGALLLTALSLLGLVAGVTQTSPTPESQHDFSNRRISRKDIMPFVLFLVLFVLECILRFGVQPKVRHLEQCIVQTFRKQLQQSRTDSFACSCVLSIVYALVLSLACAVTYHLRSVCKHVAL